MLFVDTTAKPGHTYVYRITAAIAGGKTSTFGPVSVTVPVTEFALAPVSPNPSRGADVCARSGTDSVTRRTGSSGAVRVHAAESTRPFTP